jgi:hypothetical protein
MNISQWHRNTSLLLLSLSADRLLTAEDAGKGVPAALHGTMQTAGLTGSAKLAYGKRPRPTAGLRNVRMRDRRLAFAEGD